MSLLAFLDRFPTEEACLAHLEGLRWPDGPVCPKCGAVNDATKLPRARYWMCRACRHQFTVLHGTPIEGTHLPLRTWFAAVYLVAASSKGIAATRLAEQLGVSYKTAWFLGHRLRRMMQEPGFVLRGVVEVDETMNASAFTRPTAGSAPSSRRTCGSTIPPMLKATLSGCVAIRTLPPTPAPAKRRFAPPRASTRS